MQNLKKIFIEYGLDFDNNKYGTEEEQNKFWIERFNFYRQSTHDGTDKSSIDYNNKKILFTKRESEDLWTDTN